MLKIIFKNTIWQMVSRGFFVLLSLVVTSILTRKLDVSGWGNYVLITSFITILISVSDWGTQIIGVRELSKAENKKLLFSSLFLLRVLLATVSFFIGFLAIWFIPIFSDVRLAGIIALVLVFLLSFDTSFEVIFQAFLKMEIKALLDIAYMILFLILIVLFLHLDLGLVGVVLSWLISRSIIVFAGWIISKKLVPFVFKPNTGLAKTLFKESLPMGAFMLVFSAYDRGIDSFFLKYFWGEEEVGFYGLGYKVYANLVLPAYFLANSFFPVISRIKNSSKIFRTCFLTSLGISILAFVGMYLLSDLVVWILGGGRYYASIPVLKILSFALPFSYLNHIIGFGLIAKNRQLVSLIIGIGAMIVNLILNYLFIPVYSIIAASYITVATEALVLLFSALFLYFHMRTSAK